MLSDFGIISLLIILSHLLRYKIKILQSLYIPSAVVAGLIALILGSECLDILPFSLNQSGNLNILSYPGILVVLLFSTIFLGKRKKDISVKDTVKHAGDTFFFNLASILGQYGFSMVFGVLILYPLFPYLQKGFVLLLPAGFVGGHGTAAAIGGTLESYGLAGAQTVGYASATVGILIGIVGGMTLINIGTRKGWARMVKSVQAMPTSMRTGFVPEKEQHSMGKETISPIALDPLTWHLGLVVLCATFSFWISGYIEKLTTLGIPTFCIALLVGALVQKILNIIKVGKYVDRHVVHRLGSMITDYLVAFAIASISLKVVFNYALPLVLMFAFGASLTVSLVWFLGRKICKNFWFERSMLVFGWNLGTVAMSMVLVRVIDPDMQTGALEDFGVSYFGVAFVEIAIISLLPHLVSQGIIFWPTMILISSFFACIFLSKNLVGWFTSSPSAIREGEKEIMEGAFADE